MSRMRDQRRAMKQAQKDKRRAKSPAHTLEIAEEDILEEIDDLDRRMLELES